MKNNEDAKKINEKLKETAIATNSCLKETMLQSKIGGLK